MVRGLLALVWKFIVFLALPAIGLWFVVAFMAAPLVAVVPIYFKMVLTPVWFVTSFFTAMLGWKKRLSFWTYFLISLLMSPLVGIVVVVTSGNKEDEEE
jgi:hypothetical protein